jgi:hypothetical protein
MTESTLADVAEVRARNLRTVAALAAVFVLPLVLSFWMYYGDAWRPASRSNHGELLTPARPLPALTLPVHGGGEARVPLPGKWQLIYMGDGACGPSCRQSLLVMRQSRLALNAEMGRVDRLLLATANCCDGDFLGREHAGLIAIDASGAAAAPLRALFPPGGEHSLYIVDPHGNLMMRYDARQDPKGLLADLKKLLKLSHIG